MRFYCKTFFFLFFIAFLDAGDRWDYYMRTHSDLYWVERNQDYLAQVAEKIAKKYQLTVQQTASSLPPFTDCKWAYSFTSIGQLTPVEGAPFIRKIFKETLAEIHRNREAVLFLTEDVDAKKFSPTLIGLKIAFFQKDKKRAQPPYVARLYIDQGKAYYNLFGDGEEPFLESISLD